MIHLLSTHPAWEAFQVWLLRSGYIVCWLHNLSAGKDAPTSPRFQLRAHTWGRLSSRIKVSVGRFHRGLRRRDSDCDGFACFLNWAMCKWGGKNRFQCLVHSHWFRKVMKTHCFYFTDLCCKPPHLRFVLGLSEHEWKWADAWTHMNIGYTVYIFREEPSRNSSGSDMMSLVPAAFLFFLSLVLDF